MESGATESPLQRSCPDGDPPHAVGGRASNEGRRLRPRVRRHGRGPCASRRGHDVWGVDVDDEKVGLIARGRSPVVEPGLDDLVAAGVAAGRLHATTDAAEALQHADVALLCVGTPSTDARQHRPELPVGGPSTTSGPALAVTAPPASGFHAVVVRSTVPPGTGDEIVAPAFADRPADGRWQVGTAMCPEFLREGSGVADFFDPPFTVHRHGGRRASAQAVAALFAFLGRELRHVDVRSAEALKYACNAFHATKVSFANEIGRLFRGLRRRRARGHADLLRGHASSTSRPAYLRPGFAFGGSCLPKDLRALLHMARVNNLDVPLLAGTLRIERAGGARRLDRDRSPAPAARVAMLGLSFKTETDDLRESPNVELAETLLGKGFEVRIYDPIVNPTRLIGANLRYVEARSCRTCGRLLAATPRRGAARQPTSPIVATTERAGRRRPCSREPPPAHHRPHGRLGAEVETPARLRGPGVVGVDCGRHRADRPAARAREPPGGC